MVKQNKETKKHTYYISAFIEHSFELARRKVKGEKQVN